MNANPSNEDLGASEQPQLGEQPSEGKSVTEVPSKCFCDLYCTGCKATVSARLTNGAEIYPHRPDLASLPFWKCDWCNSYVGCHHKTANPTKPLGVIPTKALRLARRRIHDKLDPLWQEGNWNRKSLYAHLNAKLGYNYHTADIRSLEQAEEVLTVVNDLLTESDHSEVSGDLEAQS